MNRNRVGLATHFRYSRSAGSPGRCILPKTALVMKRHSASIASSTRPVGQLALRGLWSVAVAPDGKLLASGSEDGTVALWEMPSGHLLKNIDTKQGSIRGVAFAPNGRELASGGLDNAVCLWEVPSGRLRHRLTGHKERVTCVAYSPNGKLLASGSWDNTVYIWDPINGEALRRLDKGLKVLVSLNFGPDNKTLVASSCDANPLLVWDATTGKAIREVPVSSGGLCFGAVSPNGRMIAGATTWKGEAVHVWDAATGEVRRRLRGLPSAVRCLAFSPDGRRLTAGDKEGRILLWDCETGQEIPYGDHWQSHGGLASVWFVHGGPIAWLAIAADGKTWASAGTNGQIRIWHDSPSREIRRLRFDSAPLLSIALSSDGKVLATGGASATIRLHEVTSGKEICRINADSPAVLNLTFARDDRTLASLDAVPFLQLWRPYAGKPGQEFAANDRNAWTATRRFALPHAPVMALSHDGSMVAFVGTHGSIILGDVSTGREKRIRTDLEGPWLALRLAPTGRTMAIGAEGAIHIHETATSSRRQLLQGLQGMTEVIAYSPDSRLLAATTSEHHAYLWDLATGNMVHQFLGERSKFNSVFFSPEGQAFAVSSDDDAVFLAQFPDLLKSDGKEPAKLNRFERERLWHNLAAAVPGDVRQAIWALVRDQRDSVSFLHDRLKKLPGPPVERIPQFLRDLDDNRFAVRERASAELETLGNSAEPALLAALENKPSPEVRHRVNRLLQRQEGGTRTPDALRMLRGVEVLEQIGSVESGKALESLSREAANEWLKREAKASLDRLSLNGRKP
jgi:WD40 repeat protein